MTKSNSDAGWWGIIRLLSRTDSEEQMEKHLQLFLTPDERQDLAARYMIIKHLTEAKLTQREIAAELGVSISKITRGSNSLKLIDDQTRQQLQDLFN